MLNVTGDNSLPNEQESDLLESFLRVADDEKNADGSLAELLSERLLPVIRAAISHQLRPVIDVWVYPQIAEDLLGEIIVRLLTELRRLQTNREARTIDNIQGYVYSVARHTCNDYLRELYPQMRRLQDQLRYWFTHHPQLEIWKNEEGVRLCGYKAWRHEGRVSVSPGRWRQIAETSEAKQRAQPKAVKGQQRELAAFIEQVLAAAGAPVTISALTRLTADRLGINQREAFVEGRGEEIQPQAYDSRNAPVFPDHANEIEHRLYLARVWQHIGQLSLPQRRALLLNLRSGSDRGLIVSFSDLRIATIPQLATMLEVPLEVFLQLWRRLPLDDDDIAALFEMTRQQVVNHRSAARKRLTQLLSGA